MRVTVETEQLSSDCLALVRLHIFELRMLLRTPDISFIIGLGLMNHETYKKRNSKQFTFHPEMPQTANSTRTSPSFGKWQMKIVRSYQKKQVLHQEKTFIHLKHTVIIMALVMSIRVKQWDWVKPNGLQAIHEMQKVIFPINAKISKNNKIPVLYTVKQFISIFREQHFTSCQHIVFCMHVDCIFQLMF